MACIFRRLCRCLFIISFLLFVLGLSFGIFLFQLFILSQVSLILSLRIRISLRLLLPCVQFLLIFSQLFLIVRLQLFIGIGVLRELRFLRFICFLFGFIVSQIFFVFSLSFFVGFLCILIGSFGGFRLNHQVLKLVNQVIIIGLQVNIGTKGFIRTFDNLNVEGFRFCNQLC